MHMVMPAGVSAPALNFGAKTRIPVTRMDDGELVDLTDQITVASATPASKLWRPGDIEISGADVDAALAELGHEARALDQQA